MLINGRKILFHKDFVVEVRRIQKYLRQFSSQSAIKFVVNLDKLIFEKIALRPTSFPEFKYKRTPNKIFRRAIYKKKYVVVYKLESTKITLVFIYHSSRNPENLDF